MFPRNGALIKVENILYTNQDHCVQVSLMFKGDTFTVNFLNPLSNEIPVDQDEVENETKEIEETEQLESIKSSDVGMCN